MVCVGVLWCGVLCCVVLYSVMLIVCNYHTASDIITLYSIVYNIIVLCCMCDMCVILYWIGVMYGVLYGIVCWYVLLYCHI